MIVFVTKLEYIHLKYKIQDGGGESSATRDKAGHGEG